MRNWTQAHTHLSRIDTRWKIPSASEPSSGTIKIDGIDITRVQRLVSMIMFAHCKPFLMKCLHWSVLTSKSDVCATRRYFVFGNDKVIGPASFDCFPRLSFFQG